VVRRPFPSLLNHQYWSGTRSPGTNRATHTENDLLGDLGILDNPGRTEEEEQKWSKGLREVITELRKSGVKDAETIAYRAMKLKRDLFGDTILERAAPVRTEADFSEEGEVEE